jgi:8-oxo-dGTP pyrophosphatase MutT (NUDIX family)
MDKKRYAGVVVKCNDKVLLAKRNNLGSYPGMWSIFGGRVEEGEDTRDAARREFFEETSIKIDDHEISFVGIIPRHTRDGKKVKGMMYVYQLDTDEPIIPNLGSAIDGDEHTECGYFGVKQISSEKSGTYLHKLLEIILEKNSQ